MLTPFSLNLTLSSVFMYIIPFVNVPVTTWSPPAVILTTEPFTDIPSPETVILLPNSIVPVLFFHASSSGVGVGSICSTGNELIIPKTYLVNKT